MMGLRGESMNPMTFGNITHPIVGMEFKRVLLSNTIGRSWCRKSLKTVFTFLLCLETLFSYKTVGEIKFGNQNQKLFTQTLRRSSLSASRFWVLEYLKIHFLRIGSWHFSSYQILKKLLKNSPLLFMERKKGFLGGLQILIFFLSDIFYKIWNCQDAIHKNFQQYLHCV